MQIVLSEYNLLVAASEATHGRTVPTPVKGGAPPKCSPRAKLKLCADQYSQRVARDRRLIDAWHAIQASIAAVGITHVRWGSRSMNHTRIVLARLARHLLVCAEHSGVGAVVARVKAAAAEARLTAICGEPLGPNIRCFLRMLPKRMASRKGLEQFSFVGRALPRGDDLVARRSLKKHRDVISQPFVCSDETLSAMRQYARHVYVHNARKFPGTGNRAFLHAVHSWMRNRFVTHVRSVRPWMHKELEYYREAENWLRRRYPGYSFKVVSRETIPGPRSASTGYVTWKLKLRMTHKVMEILAKALSREVRYIPKPNAKPRFRELLRAGPSACLEVPRTKGGVREAVRTLAPTWISRVPDDVRFVGVSAASKTKLLRRKGLTINKQVHRFAGFVEGHEFDTAEADLVWGPPAVARAAAYLTQPLVRHQIHCLPEHGFKTRVITVPPAYVSVASRALNTFLMSFIKKDPRCEAFLSGEPRRAVESVVRKGRPDWLFMSSDLTAASDRLPLDLVRSCVEGLVDVWFDAPSVWVDALRTCTGPQTVVYPNGDEVMLRRGILMGLGTTWPLLSVIHLFWVDYAAERVGTPEAVYAALHCTRIGGDDLIGFWPKALCEEYAKVVVECGGSFSEGKSFLTRLGGNFAENLFYFRDDRIHWGLAVPLKGLLYGDPGLAFESSALFSGKMVRSRRVLRALRGDGWNVKSLPVLLPTCVGGLGLPPKKGNPLRIRGSFISRLAGGKYLYGSSDPVGPPSRMKASSQESRQAEKAVLSALGTRFFRLEKGDSAPVEEVVSRLTSRFALISLFGKKKLPPGPSGPMSLPSYRVAYKRWVKRTLAHAVPSALALTDGAPSRMRLILRSRRRLLSFVAAGP